MRSVATCSCSGYGRLHHEQYSVFTGDLTEAELIRLRKELNRTIVPGDRVTLVLSPNRHNVQITHLVKESHKGKAKQKEDHRHRN